MICLQTFLFLQEVSEISCPDGGIAPGLPQNVSPYSFSDCCETDICLAGDIVKKVM